MHAECEVAHGEALHTQQAERQNRQAETSIGDSSARRAQMRAASAAVEKMSAEGSRLLKEARVCFLGLHLTKRSPEIEAAVSV